jgi:putative hemolysin
MKYLVVLFVALSALNVMPAFAGGGSSIGVGNPAAKNCIELGGKLQILDVQGQAENCLIEEWNLFRTMYRCHLVQVHHYGSPGQIGMANPASVNCADIGGQIQIMKSPTGGEFGVCVVEEWKLFRSVDASKCR